MRGSCWFQIYKTYLCPILSGTIRPFLHSDPWLNIEQWPLSNILDSTLQACQPISGLAWKIKLYLNRVNDFSVSLVWLYAVFCKLSFMYSTHAYLKNHNSATAVGPWRDQLYISVHFLVFDRYRYRPIFRKYTLVIL